VIFGFQINEKGHDFFTNMQLWDPKDKEAIEKALKNLHGWYDGYEERINKVIVKQVRNVEILIYFSVESVDCRWFLKIW
jgi:hypothetical protein